MPAALARRFSVRCLLLGLLFFAASLTPSLIPRDPVTQGVLGGLVTALGYLLGRLAALVWHMADMPRAPAPLARGITIAMAVAVVPLFVWTMVSSREWQNALRAKMEMVPADALHAATILVTAVAVFAVACMIGAGLAALLRVVQHYFYRVMPRRRANVLGFMTVAVILFIATRDGLIDTLVAFVDTNYEAAQNLFENAPPRPGGSRITGSSASLVNWEAMGQPGRNFVTSGPSAADISAFSGRPALEPVRVYVGRANADTAQERAALALAELQRVDAFEREVLIVTSPTGTGWMDPGSHDVVEYMHGGDIATVGVQYSYLQSPLALIFETSTGLEQATALLETVHEYWKTLPENRRPRLYVHGLSLGAWSSMHATNLFRLVNDPIDGAFWAGPPFPSRFWNYVQNTRQPGSPWVLPTVGDGSLVRYASHVADVTQAQADWGAMRIVFLQYSSDPIVFYDPRSLWRPPPWMNEPPAEDVSERLQFIPVVTQFQLAVDMALSFGAPPGHGHSYFARDYIAPWAEVTAPAGWTRADTARLREYCSGGAKAGCRVRQ